MTGRGQGQRQCNGDAEDIRWAQNDDKRRLGL
jgi:hypothetical protein